MAVYMLATHFSFDNSQMSRKLVSIKSDFSRNLLALLALAAAYFSLAWMNRPLRPAGPFLHTKHGRQTFPGGLHTHPHKPGQWTDKFNNSGGRMKENSCKRPAEQVPEHRLLNHVPNPPELFCTTCSCERAEMVTRGDKMR